MNNETLTVNLTSLAPQGSDITSSQNFIYNDNQTVIFNLNNIDIGSTGIYKTKFDFYNNNIKFFNSTLSASSNGYIYTPPKEINYKYGSDFEGMSAQGSVIFYYSNGLKSTISLTVWKSDFNVVDFNFKLLEPNLCYMDEVKNFIPIKDVSNDVYLLTVGDMIPKAVPLPTPSATPSVEICGPPSLTPTPSVTPSITPTPSVTPSITPTVSVTPSVTSSITVTPSVTPSITPTPSDSTFVEPPLPTPATGTNCIIQPNAGGPGIFEDYLPLDPDGGLVTLIYTALGVVDKFELIHDGVKVATSSMSTVIGSNYGPFDNNNPPNTSGDQYIGTNKGSIPNRLAEYEADTGVTGQTLGSYQQIMWWQYGPAEYNTDTNVQLRVSGPTGTAWRVSNACYLPPFPTPTPTYDYVAPNISDIDDPFGLSI